MATRLLKLYLKKELKVTKIYQVITYQPDTCFKKIGDTVSDVNWRASDRRVSDLDDNCAMESETMKLLDTAANGKTLTSEAKHSNLCASWHHLRIDE